MQFRQHGEIFDVSSFSCLSCEVILYDLCKFRKLVAVLSFFLLRLTHFSLTSLQTSPSELHHLQ